GPRGSALVESGHLHTFQELVGGCLTESVIVGEHVQAAQGHLSASGSAIVFEHQRHGPPEHLQVRGGDAGASAQGGTEVAVATEEAVGEGVFGAHLGALSLFHVLLSGLGDAGDAVWLWQNGTDGTGEGELERALHTSSRHLPGGHNRTEHPYIGEVLAHPFLGLGFGDSALLLVGERKSTRPHSS